MAIYSTSTAAFYDRSRMSMSSLRLQAESYQQQLSTGDRLERSSDDPVAASRLRTLSRTGRLSQIDAANADRAATDLTLADSTLSSIADVLARAQELAVQAGSSTMSDTNRAAIATEMEQIHQQLFSLANTRDATGHALFGGETAGDAYALNGAGTAVYIGTAAADELDVGEGQNVPRSVTGPDIFAFDDNGTPADAMAVVQQLAAALAGASADPAAAARDAAGSLSNAIENVTTSQTVVGARLAWIDFVQARQTDMGELRAAEENELGGIDIASTVINLQEALTALEASQASFTKLSSISLFNHIG
ncbi:flagellar hook-associated protein FlgL [Croceicoccus mobilis]|uniref:Flagellin N-terminal domain-containing protein n=1 Tax=Croceicoccus mobilis TaxID=1703339 RepID=A0A916YW99_9SPHN|nr:flagellar hook-associated protein FlgL [Croceicoccus mobilis]GGD63905.1 hypothetical protein GCM10010990_11730 [Croceicoccus mobilis]